MKPGSKLKSQVCDAEVMVIRGGDGQIECGGVPMSDEKASEPGAPAADHANGTLMGKRYVDAGGTVELLCIKPGKGSLSLEGNALTIKDAKPLPASD